ncbi:homeobox-leucine zipper protein PROTODERMAL FACTOR 2-like [Carica papaya]|uniref:homeobox-leucine zipper protein PROTODERMAL FACTOR 2-like n=1 Tax=Carica papaya TaxID=3649 RepID=UPI000B8CD8B7|nr:homeobox-leucine zipper protein PROTODERMAL FACTOR 2-like [Carica papaya]
MFEPNMFESHHLFDMTPKTSDSELIGKIRDDDYETKSGTETAEANSGDDQDPNQRPKKKRYHRHTQRQIQEMEAFFKECPHPDDKQRKALSRELGLEPLQVKFWFQNKRTQMKAQNERHENAILKAENEKLRAENNRYKEALSNASCPNCGGPAALGEMSFDEQHLRIENVRLKEEIDRISGIAAKYVGKPMDSFSQFSSHTRSLDLGVSSFGAQSGGGFVGEISMDDPGRPPGIVLSAATSFWIPVSPKRVFEFLRNENSRSEWDILSNGGLVQEMAHIANGREPGNCVSLLRVNSANSSQSNMLILQESCTDSTGSYVIYAPVDIAAMNIVLSGGDPDYVALLPSGFAILPDGPAGLNATGIMDVGSGGSLLTVAFQILVDSIPTAKLSLGSVATVNSLIKCTIERIKTAVI